MNKVLCPYCGYEQTYTGDRVVCEGCKKVIEIDENGKPIKKCECNCGHQHKQLQKMPHLWVALRDLELGT